MDVVIDANIIFSILIKKGFNDKILIEKEIHIYAPFYLKEELLEHSDEILFKTHRSYEEFLEIFKMLMEQIEFVDFELKHYIAASKICSDKDDVPYVALALKLNLPIWSEDKILKKDFIKVYNTKELVNFP
jgi:predicted nucleic acid-binding protein